MSAIAPVQVLQHFRERGIVHERVPLEAVHLPDAPREHHEAVGRVLAHSRICIVVVLLQDRPIEHLRTQNPSGHDILATQNLHLGTLHPVCHFEQRPGLP